ncbi:hypothetical protein M5689_000747 [Euphorbia peplus]|nr:hypothetical protein M5689_000747 [Euphorbia peplus]
MITPPSVSVLTPKAAYAIGGARAIWTNLVATPLNMWSSDELERAMDNFDLLTIACTSHAKAKSLKSIKRSVVFSYQLYMTARSVASSLVVCAKSNMAELTSFNKRYDALIEEEKKDKKRVPLFDVEEQCLLELEQKIAESRAKIDDLTMEGAMFQDYFPRMEDELNHKKARLADHYTKMVEWHKQREKHKQAAVKLCEE